MRANDQYEHVWREGQVVVAVGRHGGRVWVAVYDRPYEAIEMGCYEADRLGNALREAAAMARAMVEEEGEGDV
jgi:hypothetical protein